MAFGTPVAGAAQYSASGGTTVAPAFPTGILASDAVLLFVGQKPSTANGGTVTTPTGWTLREEITGAGGYGTTLGADTGNTNLRVYSWNTPVAGQTGTLSVTLGVNDVSWAFIVRVPTGGGTLSYGSADGQRTTTPTSPMSIALTNGTSATAFTTGDIALWAMCIPTDVTTPSQFSAQSITATGATFGTAVELNEPDSATGNDIGGYGAYASVSSGTSSTAPTVSVTIGGTLTNVRGGVGLVRIRETVVTRTGSLAATETGLDVFAGAGDVIVSGAMAVAELGNDTFAATGTVSSSAITGSLAATEVGEDVFSSSGNIIISGALATSEAGADTFSSSGNVIVQGSLAATEAGNDSFNAGGLVLVQGNLSATETGNDTFLATGSVNGNAVTGSLNATEVGSDAFQSSGLVLIHGSLSANESGDDSFSASGFIQQVTSGITGGGIRRSKILEAAQWILDLLDKDTVKQTEQIKKVKAKLKKVKKPQDLEDLQPIVNTAIVEIQKQKKLADDIAQLNFVINELKLIKNQLDDEEEALLMLIA